MSLTISSFAGSEIGSVWSGSPPYDGTGGSARFNRPQTACVDASGNVYVVDTDLHTVRKITSAGVVTTLAGSAGITGSADGTGSAARFNFGGGLESRGGIAVDASGNVFVADTENHTIRKITSAGVVTTFAGANGMGGLVNGTGSAARFNKPTSIAIDNVGIGSGTLYVADRENGCIRKITTAGAVTTFVGTAAPGGGGGYLNGTGLGVYFSSAGLGLTIDSGTLYVADIGNNCIRKVTSAGVVTTLAGAAPSSLDIQQPSPIGAIDGAGSSARFNGPRGVAVDASGKIYVADTGNQTIRMVDKTSGVTTTEAGIVWNDYGYDNGTGAAARFYKPYGVACLNTQTISTTGKLYVVDTWNHSIRLAVAGGSTPVATPAISSSSTASGIVGTAFSYQITASNSPTSFGATNLPAGLSVNTSTGLITGTPTGGGTNNVTISATNSQGLGSAGLVITISGPATVPAITSGLQPTGVVGQPFSYQITATGNPTSFNFNTGGLFGLNVNTSTGLITGTPSIGGQGYSVVYATNSVGTGQATILITIAVPSAAPTNPPSFTSVTLDGFTVNWDEDPEAVEYSLHVSASPTFATYDASTLVVESGYPANSATRTSLSLPGGVVPITPGTNYYARVAVVNAEGATSAYSPVGTTTTAFGTGTGLNILTFAGLSGTAWPGSPASYDGTGSNARFNQPRGMCVDASGNVYVSDTEAHTIRKITSAGVVTTLAGSPGQSGSANGQGATARFNAPRGICVDSTTGNLYVADTENHIIRKITSAGLVTTLVGTAGVIGSANGTGAAASFNQPWGIVINPAGSQLCVTDTNNNAIRKINISTLVTYTFAGATTSGTADGIASAARFSGPTGITIDSSENLYVCDSYNSTIRKVDLLREVTTLAGLAGVTGSSDGTGSAARFMYPLGITIDSAGKLYVADTTNLLIRRVDSSSGATITEAGQLGVTGAQDGLGATTSLGSVAQFFYPNALAVSPSGSSVAGGQTLYIADTNNHSIRTAKLSVGTTPVITSPATASGSVGTAFSYQIVATNSPTAFNSPSGVPPGLTINPANGLISGTPTAAATSMITLSATNASGTGFLTLTITIAVATNSALSVGIATKTSISADLRRQGYYQVVSFTDAINGFIYHRTDGPTPSVSGPTSPYGSVASLSIVLSGCVPITFYDVSTGLLYEPSVNKQIKTTAGVLVATLASSTNQQLANQYGCVWLAGSMSFATAKSGVTYEAFDTGTSNNPVLVRIYTVRNNSSSISYNGGGKYSSDVGQVSCVNVWTAYNGTGDAGGGLDLNSVYVEADAGPIDLSANVRTSTRLIGAVSGGKVLLDVEISPKTSLVATLDAGAPEFAAVVSTVAPTYADGGVLVEDGWLVGTSIEADLRIAPRVELVARPRSKTSIEATTTADVVVRSIVAGKSIISANIAGSTGIEGEISLGGGRYAGTLVKSYVIPAQLNMSSSLRVDDDLFRINPIKVEISAYTATSIKADLGYIRVELAATLAGSASLAASVARLTLLGTSDLRQVNIFEAGKVSSGTIGGLGQRWVKRSDLQNNDLTTSVEWVEGSPPQLD